MLLLALLPAAGLLWAQVNVLTYHNDLARTGQNLSELLLTKTAVASSRFQQLFSQPVDGYVYAQPLYLADLNIPGKGTHNVVFVATEHDSVYAFDADSNTGINSNALWHVSFLGPGITTVTAQNVGCSQIVPEIGITGTPVIDPSSGTMYLVSMTLEGATYVHRLHALDTATGAERLGSPVVIEASVAGTGEGGTVLTFEAKNYKQRPGLVLLNGVVYTSWSSHCDIGKYHGWLIGYDATTLKQVAVYNNTPNGNEGSFWASGAAPAVDAGGNIYLAAGNGTFDADRGGSDLGESFIKLSTPGGLHVIDWFTPFNYASLNSGDVDIGSSGLLLLPDSVGSTAHPHLMVSAGKEARIYLLDRENLGHFQSGGDTQIPQSLTGTIGALFGIPAYFNNTVYFSGVSDNLKAFPIQNGQLARQPSSQSATRFGFPGSVPSISANGSDDGIVWAIEPAGGGRLHAYDASDLSKELFSAAIGSYVKFSVPTIANGKVYAGTQTSVAVFGLHGGAVPTVSSVANAASFQSGSVAPGSLISIFGTNLAGSPASASGFPLPNELGGTAVSINGNPAPLLYVSPRQINAQVPFETGVGTATVIVNGTAASFPLAVQAAAPGLFTFTANQAAVQNQDGIINGPDHPVPAGKAISAYLTGQGPVNPPVSTGAAAPFGPFAVPTLPLTAMLGGRPAAITFSGLAPGLAGVFQVNLTVPALASGTYQLVITVNGVPSNAGLVSVM